ncbi:MAG TPA: hypoxanthine phosphoribosyltransferase [Blastocatellia bacterium]|jgi:hypoxanthine phosphoribosyltransferase|nr:hypoxanthine phosphoribosyltransferase [Blastocatellia bacterium]
MAASEPVSFIHDPSLKVLIDREQIRARVRELGAAITRDYTGRNLHLLAVLKGACVFLSDLMREIDLPLSIDFIGISSYGDSTRSSGEVRITKDLDKSLAGKDVLVVEDIIDTGLTLNYMINIFLTREVNSLEVVALLDKPDRHEIEINPKYLGFTIPNHFVVGYGLDVSEMYRNLPFIGVPEDPEGLLNKKLT